MKLYRLLSLTTVKPKRAITIALCAASSFIAPVLAAQQQTFRVLSEHSTARLFIGTSEQPKSLNVAVVRVSGEISINPSHLDGSAFNFQMYAANEAQAGDRDQQALAGDQPVISFRSKHIEQRVDGMIQVDGVLIVTQTERHTVVGSGEDYSGPVYGRKQLVHTRHAATFVFAPLPLQSSSDKSSIEGTGVHLQNARQALPENAFLLTAFTSVNCEAFPELLSSIKNAAWPAAVNEAKCAIPPTVGEDYSGQQCSGEVIAPLPSLVLPVQAGEDYSGIRTEPPQGKQVAIDLSLVLVVAPYANTGRHPENMGKSEADVLRGDQPR